MGLMDDVKADQEQAKRTQCRICRLLDEGSPLSAEDQEDLTKVLADMDGFTASAISRVLETRGAKLDQGSIQRHRRLHQ